MYVIVKENATISTAGTNVPKIYSFGKKILVIESRSSSGVVSKEWTGDKPLISLSHSDDIDDNIKLIIQYGQWW